MAQVTIYLPDDLREEVRAAGLNVSQVCQEALRKALFTPAQVQAMADQALARHQPRTALDLLPIPVPIDPVEQMIGCTDKRHVGPFERLGDYGKRCGACGKLL